jgi:hypothetical protein
MIQYPVVFGATFTIEIHATEGTIKGDTPMNQKVSEVIRVKKVGKAEGKNFPKGKKRPQSVSWRRIVPLSRCSVSLEISTDPLKTICLYSLFSIWALTLSHRQRLYVNMCIQQECKKRATQKYIFGKLNPRERKALKKSWLTWISQKNAKCLHIL